MHHSHATAAAADSLARIVHPGLAQEAFIAGLLHNLGVAAQIHLEPDERREWRLPPAAHEMRVRSVQVKEITPLPRHSVELVATPARFEFKDSDTAVFVRNPNPFPVQVALESGAGEQPRRLRQMARGVRQLLRPALA